MTCHQNLFFNKKKDSLFVCFLIGYHKILNSEKILKFDNKYKETWYLEIKSLQLWIKNNKKISFEQLYF